MQTAETSLVTAIVQSPLRAAQSSALGVAAFGAFGMLYDVGRAVAGCPPPNGLRANLSIRAGNVAREATVAGIGGAIGTVIIPVPVLGTCVGGVVGSVAGSVAAAVLWNKETH